MTSLTATCDLVWPRRQQLQAGCDLLWPRYQRRACGASCPCRCLPHHLPACVTLSGLPEPVGERFAGPSANGVYTLPGGSLDAVRSVALPAGGDPSYPHHYPGGLTYDPCSVYSGTAYDWLTLACEGACRGLTVRFIGLSWVTATISGPPVTCYSQQFTRDFWQLAGTDPGGSDPGEPYMFPCYTPATTTLVPTAAVTCLSDGYSVSLPWWLTGRRKVYRNRNSECGGPNEQVDSLTTLPPQTGTFTIRVRYTADTSTCGSTSPPTPTPGGDSGANMVAAERLTVNKADCGCGGASNIRQALEEQAKQVRANLRR